MFQQIHTTNQIFELGYTQSRHPFPRLFRNEGEEIHDPLDVAHKVVITQRLILGGNTGCTVIEMTDSEVFATHSDHRRRTKAKAFST